MVMPFLYWCCYNHIRFVPPLIYCYSVTISHILPPH